MLILLRLTLQIRVFAVEQNKLDVNQNEMFSCESQRVLYVEIIRRRKGNKTKIINV